jgi:hypothetical protein
MVKQRLKLTLAKGLSSSITSQKRKALNEDSKPLFDIQLRPSDRKALGRLSFPNSQKFRL